MPFGRQQRKAEGMLFGSADPELHEAAPESKGAPGLQSSAGTQLEAQS